MAASMNCSDSGMFLFTTSVSLMLNATFINRKFTYSTALYFRSLLDETHDIYRKITIKGMLISYKIYTLDSMRSFWDNVFLCHFVLRLQKYFFLFIYPFLITF